MNKRSAYIKGRRIYLKGIQISNANFLYCSWLNDPKVNSYLCCRFEKWTLPKMKRYISDTIKDPANYFWAIYRQDTNTHIGNIKLGDVNLNYKYGDIGVIIGERCSWGKGFATEAIQLVKEFAFNKLGLHKLTAGSYANNYGSICAFQKVGFFMEGRRKQHFVYKKKYVDQILFGCINTKSKANIELPVDKK